MVAGQAAAEETLRARHRLRPGQENDFDIETASEVLDAWNTIKNVLLAAGPGLVAVALVVGGIVIMNIMLMSVLERTREIGVRKALGARRVDITRQFLAESATPSHRNCSRTSRQSDATSGWDRSATGSLAC
jgi:putative ABC transport system permease protein